VLEIDFLETQPSHPKVGNLIVFFLDQLSPNSGINTIYQAVMMTLEAVPALEIRWL
jgi:hypothetical protein